eukprot:scaffold9942_cov57-Phaeocystis_antarctica.AAC.6
MPARRSAVGRQRGGHASGSHCRLCNATGDRAMSLTGKGRARLTVRLFPMPPRPARDVRVGVEREHQPVRRHAIRQLVERVEHRAGAVRVLLAVETGEEVARVEQARGQCRQHRARVVAHRLDHEGAAAQQQRGGLHLGAPRHGRRHEREVRARERGGRAREARGEGGRGLLQEDSVGRGVAAVEDAQPRVLPRGEHGAAHLLLHLLPVGAHRVEQMHEGRVEEREAQRLQRHRDGLLESRDLRVACAAHHVQPRRGWLGHRDVPLRCRRRWRRRPRRCLSRAVRRLPRAGLGVARDELRDARPGRLIPIARHLEAGMEHEAAPRGPPLRHRAQVAAVAAHRGGAAVLAQVGRVQRVRVAVGHRDELLLGHAAPHDEALVRGAVRELGPPQRVGLVDARPAERAHLLAQLHPHAVGEDLAHAHVARRVE